MNSKLIIQLAFLLVVAAGINWYLEPRKEEPGNSLIQQNDPDLYMTDASLAQFDAAGNLQHRIQASRFTHFPVSDITTLDSPNITLFKKNDQPWKIRSISGHILPAQKKQGSTLELWDSVLVERTSESGQFINIRTENLTVLPDQDYAETDQAVIIDHNTSRTTASGMKAYLKPGKFHFYSTPPQRVDTVILPGPDPS